MSTVRRSDRSKSRLSAFVHWNAGLCSVIDDQSRQVVATSKHFRRATRRARNAGYAVRVYKGEYAKAPRDAIDVSLGSYVLPPRELAGVCKEKF